MFKIVRNKGQCKHFRGKSNKFLICTNNFIGGEIHYADVSLKSLIGYIHIQKIEKEMKRRGLL